MNFSAYEYRFEINLFKIEHLCPFSLQQMVSYHPCSSGRRLKSSIFVGVTWYLNLLYKISWAPFLTHNAIEVRYRINLLLWSKLILWSRSKSPDTPAEKDDFQLLPYDRGWQDTIHFKDEGLRCSILKRWVLSCAYILRNIIRDFRELPQRGRHIQLMELPISSICWLSDYSPGWERKKLNLPF